MDLPKNVTQIGEADAKCKIYVEDYVVSFLKQLNPLARDKTMAAALYGRRKMEEDRTYLFVYGAGKLDFIQKEVRHLSQAQKQEIERIRKQYFGEYEFLGYRILDGEMVEGFHVLEQDACRYISGYAQFYENNEAMLSYMLESRQVEAAPENVDSEKYEAVRSRQEMRRAKYVRHQKEKEEGEEGKRTVTKTQFKGIQVTAAAVFVLLCALGVAMNSSVMEEKGWSLEKLKQEFAEKKLPDVTVTSGQAAGPGQDVTSETLKVEDKLASAVQKENQSDNGQVSKEGNQDQTQPPETEKQQEAVETLGKAEVGGADEKPDAGKPENGKTDDGKTDAENAGDEQTGNDRMNPGQSDEGQAVDEQAQPKVPVTYVVRQGDTLTAISIRTYGNESYVGQICQLNAIQNPDEIKIGQKILLP